MLGSLGENASSKHVAGKTTGRNGLQAKQSFAGQHYDVLVSASMQGRDGGRRDASDCRSHAPELMRRNRRLAMDAFRNWGPISLDYWDATAFAIAIAATRGGCQGRE